MRRVRSNLGYIASNISMTVVTTETERGVYMYLSILWYCKGESIQRLLAQHDLEGLIEGGMAIEREISDLPKACIIFVVNETKGKCVYVSVNVPSLPIP